MVTAEIGTGFVINGNLFTRDYLLEAITQSEQWKSLDDVKFLSLKQRLMTLERFSVDVNRNGKGVPKGSQIRFELL
jgi:hypothetical protein